MFDNYTYILITILILILLFGISFLTNKKDHFGNINSLKIKYNNQNVINPKQLETPSDYKQKSNEKISSELSSQPLGFTKQIYASNKYPYVGQIELCASDEHCEQITAECNKNISFMGIGTRGLKNLDTTLFGINY